LSADFAGGAEDECTLPELLLHPCHCSSVGNAVTEYRRWRQRQNERGIFAMASPPPETAGQAAGGTAGPSLSAAAGGTARAGHKPNLPWKKSSCTSGSSAMASTTAGLPLKTSTPRCSPRGLHNGCVPLTRQPPSPPTRRRGGRWERYRPCRRKRFRNCSRVLGGRTRSRRTPLVQAGPAGIRVRMDGVESESGTRAHGPARGRATRHALWALLRKQTPHIPLNLFKGYHFGRRSDR